MEIKSKLGMVPQDRCMREHSSRKNKLTQMRTQQKTTTNHVGVSHIVKGGGGQLLLISQFLLWSSTFGYHHVKELQ